jgi:PAS domain S-box-containing protein
MVAFSLIVILAGSIILIGISIWTNQRQQLGDAPEIEFDLQRQTADTQTQNAVIVAREHGQVLYVNPRLQSWLSIGNSYPTLEFLAQNARPTQNFQSLFVEETQTAFQFGNRWVAATSNRIPQDNEIHVVVTLRELQHQQGATPHSELDVSVSMAIIEEIGETVNASLGVEEALQTILAVISKNIELDGGEITLWNPADQVLYQRGWVGDASYVLSLAMAGGSYALGEGITGWVARQRQPMLVSDANANDNIAPKLDDNPYQSFVAIPLLLSERFLGTLELTHHQAGHFQPHHLTLLQSISKTVSTAIHNAELYATQLKRIDDIASLQQITQGKDLENNASGVYMAMNKRIANLIEAEVAGVLVYDDRRELLVPQPPFYGLPDQLLSFMTVDVTEGTPAHDIWMNQTYWIANDVADEPLIGEIGLAAVVAAAGLQNLILVMMGIGQHPIGMMFVGNKKSLAGFSTQDVQNLRILVTQAAIVVENIRLFQREQRHDTELVGLQEITHAIGALSSENSEQVYSDINMRIAGLMNIQMCGILLHDNERNHLVAQPPFFGVEDDAISDYVIDLDRNEVIAEIWEQEDYWYTNRAQTDTLVFSAGLADIAEQIGIEKTLMASLVASGEKIGVIQVANKYTNEDFTDNDARLLLIFATQAAAILENARLVREVRRRASESERLRRIAEQAGNVVSLDDTLTPVLSEVAEITHSQVVWLSVFHDQSGSLIITPRSVFGIELDQVIRIDRTNQYFEECVALTQQSLLTNHANGAPTSPYQPLVEKLGIEQMVIVPLVIGERSLGELGIANPSEGAYTSDVLAVLSTISAQLSSTIDRVRLFDIASENLDRRVRELDAISNVSRQLNKTIDLDAILESVREGAITATNAHGSTIAVVRPVETFDTATPSDGFHYRIGEQDHITGLADVEQAALASADGVVLVMSYPDTDLSPQPREAVSAVALTVVFADTPVGVLHLYDTRPASFDDRSVSFLLTLASKVSLGYGNAVRYHEQMQRSQTLRQRVEQLNQIFELGQMLQTNVDQSMMLEAIAYSIIQSVGFDVVVITMVNPDTNILERKTQAGLPVDVFERSKQDTMPVSQLDMLLTEDYHISESYFFPIENILEMNIAGLDALSAAFTGNRTMHGGGKNSWRDGDMLLVPIMGANSELLGMISLDRPQDNQRPTRAKIEILEIFAHQAATTIENNRLYLNSVQSAEQEARLNEMLEDIASTLDVNEIIQSVAYNALRVAPFGCMTVALQADNAYQLSHVRVQPDDTLVTTYQEHPTLADTALGKTIAENQEYVYTLADQASFTDLRTWRSEGEQLSIVMPLASGGETLGALHFGSTRQDLDTQEYRRLFGRVTQLMAVAIQNARLFNQAVNLRLFNESVLESIQQGIIVLDRNARVISANEFMADEYGWDVNQTGENLFDYSPELENILATDLAHVLDTAEPKQILNQRTQLPETVSKEDYVVRSFYMYPLVSQGNVSGAVLLVEDVTERARLEANVERRANQLAALTRASGQITSSLQRDEVIETALDVMQDIIAFDTITLWRREANDTMRLMGARGVKVALSPPIRVDVSQFRRVANIMQNQSPVVIEDLAGFLEHNTLLPGDSSMGSWLGVPLINQGHVVGMISLAKREPAFYGAQEEQAGTAFANQVAVALSNAELFEDTTARTERLSILNRVSLALVQSMDSENIVEIALTEIANTVNSEKSRAILFDANRELGRVVVDQPRSDQPPTEQIKLPSHNIFQYAINTMQPLVYSHDRSNMPVELPDDVREAIELRGLKDYLLVPMIAPGHVVGLLAFETHSRNLKLDPETLETGLIIANQSAIAIQNADQLEQTTSRTRELETLLEAAQSTSLTMDVNEIFQTVADLFISALDMDDCAIMIWDEMENMLEVQLDVNRQGNPDRISPRGTRFDVNKYPSRARALQKREVIVVDRDNPDPDPLELAELESQGDQARMFVPLVVKDESRGLIQVEVTNPYRHITAQERRLARALGAQVAVAIENARLQTETAAQMDELFIINDLSQAISANIDVDGMLAIVRDQVPSVTGARQLYVALYDDDTHTIRFPLAVSDGELYAIPPRALGDDEVSFIIRNKRPLLLGSDYFAADDIRRSLGLTNGEGDIKSYLGVPLVAGDDVLGVLAVRDEEKTRVFGLNDQRILTTVGSQLGATLQNARLFQRVQNFADEMNEEVQARTEELQEERDRLDMLYQITAELALTLDMDRVLSRALQMIASAVKADDGVIMLIDPLTDRLYNRASLTRVEVGEERPSHPAEMLAMWLIHNERELLVDDLHAADYWDETAPGAAPWCSAMAVLLETNEDVQGVMVLLSEEVAAFSEPLLNLVIAAANQVASAINNADLYQLIRDQAERLGTLLRTEQEEAEKSNAILESIADGVMLTDNQSRISLFNSAAEEMLGLPKDQVMGRTLSDLIDQYGENVASWATPIIEWSDRQQATQTDAIFPADRLSVGERVVSVNIASVYSGNQQLGAVSVFRDITRDVELDRRKNEFVRNVTHEFRTPMTSIKGYLELMMMNRNVDTQQASILPILKSNTDRLAALVEDLLTVSKIDAGETLSIEPVDLANIIDIQLTNANNRHYDKRHTVTLDIADDVPPVALDRRKTMQVIGNLIDNAFNYTPADGKIEIGLHRDSQREKSVLVYVKDNGLGIPDDFQAKIWERFSRNDETALQTDTAGTGLGLSIVKELVQMQGGDVWFESKEGVGTTFYVSFPIEYQRTATTNSMNTASGD